MKTHTRRRRVPAIVGAVVQPVTRRLARIEGLLFEIRHEQDVKLALLKRLHERLSVMAEQLEANRANIGTLLKAAKRPAGLGNARRH